MYYLRGETTHFTIWCEEEDAGAQAFADLILENCEFDFNTIASAFPVSLSSNAALSVYVNSSQSPIGGDRIFGLAGHGPQESPDIQCVTPSGFNTADEAQTPGALGSVAAVVTDWFASRLLTWGDGTAPGIGLSLAISYYLYPALSDWNSDDNIWIASQSAWLDTEPLEDFIAKRESNSLAGDGCAFLFL